jgi:site-specific recombinase XerD
VPNYRDLGHATSGLPGRAIPGKRVAGIFLPAHRSAGRDIITPDTIAGGGAAGPAFSPPIFTPAEHDAARRFRDAARAEATRTKYAADWAAFGRFCADRGQARLPADPATVAVYLSLQAEHGRAPPTITRQLAAIGYFHRQAGLQPPQRGDGGAFIAEILAGIRRARAAPPVRKSAADAPVIAAMLRAITGDTLADARDRAILAFGMASALRRAELVALTLADLTRVPAGMRVRIRRGKTDQEGAGTTIAVPDGARLAPVAHLEQWLARAGITEGFVFRDLRHGRVGKALSAQSVALIVKRRAAAAGYDGENFSAHSLRAGFLTAAAAAGASLWKMREVSRHKSVQALSAYVRDADLLRDHAGAAFL